MADAKILSETPISMAELKTELDKNKKKEKELNYRANKTEEYLGQFASFKDGKKLEEEIAKLKIPRLKDQHIKKIIDLLPKTADELKTILQGYPISVNNDNLKKIVDVVNKVAGAK